MFSKIIFITFDLAIYWYAKLIAVYFVTEYRLTSFQVEMNENLQQLHAHF